MRARKPNLRHCLCRRGRLTHRWLPRRADEGLTLLVVVQVRRVDPLDIVAAVTAEGRTSADDASKLSDRLTL